MIKTISESTFLAAYLVVRNGCVGQASSPERDHQKWQYTAKVGESQLHRSLAHRRTVLIA